jgi:hypothetical protein
MTRLLRVSLALSFITLAGAPALAQDTPPETRNASGLVDALLALRRVTIGNITTINGNIYGGVIRTTVVDRDQNDQNFTNADLAVLSLASRRAGAPAAVNCTGNRDELEACLRSRLTDVMTILFPTSLAESVSGRDPAIAGAQESLAISALANATVSEQGKLRRSDVGGLAEFEWFDVGETDGGRAWQGFYRMKSAPVAFRGRYAVMRQDTLTTKSFMASMGVHPSVKLSDGAQWRIGVDARSGLLVSTSSALNLGTIDVGAGAWTSAAKDFSRVRIGGGASFQGSHSWVPTALVRNDLIDIARALDYGLVFDVAYGGLAGLLLSKNTSLNAKLLETRPVSDDTGRPSSRLFITSLSYLIGGHTPFDVGYRVSTTEGVRTQAIFVQGNYRW